MRFTDEPGIYIPGELGIRHEDTVAVAESGCENLCPRWSGTPRGALQDLKRLRAHDKARVFDEIERCLGSSHGAESMIAGSSVTWTREPSSSSSGPSAARSDR